jgi:hypothetical protein
MQDVLYMCHALGSVCIRRGQGVFHEEGRMNPFSANPQTQTCSRAGLSQYVPSPARLLQTKPRPFIPSLACLSYLRCGVGPISHRDHEAKGRQVIIIGRGGNPHRLCGRGGALDCRIGREVWQICIHIPMSLLFDRGHEQGRATGTLKYYRVSKDILAGV